MRQKFIILISGGKITWKTMHIIRYMQGGRLLYTKAFISFLYGQH